MAVFYFVVLTLVSAVVVNGAYVCEELPTMTKVCNVSFQPEEILAEDLFQGESTSVAYNTTCPSNQSSRPTTPLLRFTTSDYSLVLVTSNVVAPETQHMHDTTFFEGSFNLTGVTWGRAEVYAEVLDVGEDNCSVWRRLGVTLPVVVLKKERAVNHVFTGVIGLLIIVYKFSFGCKLKPELVLAIVKRPVAPAIGVCLQFLLMAPACIGISRMMGMDDVSSIGLLAIGAAPGGGGSNVFAYLLNGDLELSITMTFCSTLVSLGMTPFWIWCLGRFLQDDGLPTVIPFTSVLTSLAVVAGPLILSLPLAHYKPRIAQIIAKGLKPLTGLLGVLFISLGIFFYRDSLVRVSWRVLVACFLVPIVGYTAGFASALVFKQDKARAITISLEVALQNMSLSLLIIRTSLPPPERDLAGVVPICYMFISVLYPVLAVVITWLYNKLRRTTKPVEDDVTGDMNTVDAMDTLSPNGDGIKKDRTVLNPDETNEVTEEVALTKECEVTV